MNEKLYLSYEDVKDENLKEEVIMSLIMNPMTREEIDELEFKTVPKKLFDDCKEHVDMFIARHKLGRNSEYPMCRDLIHVLAYELMIYGLKENMTLEVKGEDEIIKHIQDAINLYEEMLKSFNSFKRAETPIIIKAYTTLIVDATDSIEEMINLPVLSNLDVAAVLVERFKMLKNLCSLDKNYYEAFIFHFTVEELVEYKWYLKESGYYEVESYPESVECYI